jgi:hypothetical protein
MDDPEATAQLTLSNEVKAWLPEGSTVKLTSAGPLKSGDAPLVAKLDVEMPGAASFTGSRVLMPLAVFTVAKNPFAAEQRQNPLDFQYPRQTNDEVTLHLPDGYSIESVPETVSNDRHALIYKSEWHAAGNTVGLKRSFVINAILLSRELYGQVREFWAKALTADQLPVVLKKTVVAGAE